MAINDHSFEGYIQKVQIGDKDTKVTIVLSPESDDAFTLTSLIDFKRRGLIRFKAESLQPSFTGDDAGWELPRETKE